jgi:hypothetical protein
MDATASTISLSQAGRTVMSTRPVAASPPASSPVASHGNTGGAEWRLVKRRRPPEPEDGSRLHPGVEAVPQARASVQFAKISVPRARPLPPHAGRRPLRRPRDPAAHVRMHSNRRRTERRTILQHLPNVRRTRGVQGVGAGAPSKPGHDLGYKYVLCRWQDDALSGP